MTELEQEIRERLVLSPVECEECGERPTVYWKSGTIHLGCECGTRRVPKDCLIDHSNMPDDVSWTPKDATTD